ncbi:MULTISPECIES: DUF6054 family protein [Enterococcus]|uniref:DUF6054 family protein n=1 Tax=Enterococcus TaxID=1350 RepID=UPI00065E3368|nr:MULTISPECIES: DUF6054 family protein [Enterococcus]KAF1303412.1 hypothetical protein BAU16_05000 [Enterococcus sp. JM9B]
MAKYERHLIGEFKEVLKSCEKAIMEGSMSASYEDGSDFSAGTINVAVRVYERYSAFGGNRVSLNLTLVGEEDRIFLTAITSGGSEALIFKVNTFGEEAFLETLTKKIDEQYPLQN